MGGRGGELRGAGILLGGIREAEGWGRWAWAVASQSSSPGGGGGPAKLVEGGSPQADRVVAWRAAPSPPAAVPLPLRGRNEETHRQRTVLTSYIQFSTFRA